MKKTRPGKLPLHPQLQTIMQVLPGLQQTLGKHYEVILHDLSEPNNSIVGLSGNLTGRDIGGPITNFVLHILKKYGNDAPNHIHYRNVYKDGRLLRSTTLFIRDHGTRDIIGCLCINQDMTVPMYCMSFFEELVSFNEPAETQKNLLPENFAYDVSEVMKDVVHSVLNEYGTPVPDMHREDKINIIKKLDDSGIFMIKGAVDFVATCINVTSFTVYNYLKKVRSVLIS